MFQNKSKSRLLLVSETKLDYSFAAAQFWSVFCKPYRLDHCSNGGGLLLYISEDILSCLLNEYNPPENVECLFVEINIRKKKWLPCFSYNAHKNNISHHLHHLKKGLDVYLKHSLNDYSNISNLKSLNKEPNCF